MMVLTRKEQRRRESFLAACAGLMVPLKYAALAVLLVLISHSARSMEIDVAGAGLSAMVNESSRYTTSGSGAVDDACLPLLKSVRHISAPSTAMDRNAHTAGGAAALGLVLGVHFALGPKEVLNNRQQRNKARFDFWQPHGIDSPQALAVADYRRCKNEESLKALSGFRWSR